MLEVPIANVIVIAGADNSLMGVFTVDHLFDVHNFDNFIYLIYLLFYY